MNYISTVYRKYRKAIVGAIVSGVSAAVAVAQTTDIDATEPRAYWSGLVTAFVSAVFIGFSKANQS